MVLRKQLFLFRLKRTQARFALPSFFRYDAISGKRIFLVSKWVKYEVSLWTNPILPMCIYIKNTLFPKIWMQNLYWIKSYDFFTNKNKKSNFALWWVRWLSLQSYHFQTAWHSDMGPTPCWRSFAIDSFAYVSAHTKIYLTKLHPVFWCCLIYFRSTASNKSGYCY